MLAPLNAAEHRGIVRFGGLPVPGAMVTAAQGDIAVTAITDEAGLYAFPDIAIGVWKVRVELALFVPIEREVRIDGNLTDTEWDLKLRPVEEMMAMARAAPPPKPDQKSTPAPGPENNAVDLGDFGPGSASDAFVINGSASSAIEKHAIGNARTGAGRAYRGGVSATIDNSALNARSFSLTGQDTPKPSYNRMRFGAYFGGPLRIPRLVSGSGYFFAGYQMTRNRDGSTQTGLVPTQALRDGAVNPQARTLLTLYPLPNFEGSSDYNYQVPLVGATDQDDFQSRVAKPIGSKNFINTSFGWRRSGTEIPNLFGFKDKNGTTGVNAGATLRRMFTSRLNMDFGFQYSRLSVRVTPYFANRLNVSAEAGIAGNNQSPENWGPPTLNFSSGITALSDAQYSFTRNQTGGASYTGRWIRDLHTFTFGADVRRQQFNQLAQQDARGTFTFTGAATGSDFADFLAGIPDAAAIAFGNADKYLRSTSWDAYLADDWHVRSGVTLNAGVRWEYSSPIAEKYGRLVSLDISPGFTAVEAVTGRNRIGPLTGTRFPDSLVRPDKHGVQPRVAVAWRPFAEASTLIRAGYGVYYNTSVYQTIAERMAQQSPLSKSLSIANSPATPLTLAAGFNATPATSNTFAIDPNFRIGYAQNWQLSIQQDLPGAMVAALSYLGTKGTRGVQQFLPNTYPAGAAIPCPSCPSGFVYMSSNGNSTREAAQVELRRRLHSGLAASVEYTLARAFDNGELGGRAQPALFIAQNWLALAAERGPSNFDQRHLVRIQTQYTIGMGIAGGALLRGWKGAAFKGWTLASDLTMGSGLPETPIYPMIVSGTGITGSLRPDATGVSPDSPSPGRFLNPAAFRAPSAGAWGNAGRNSVVGPAQFLLNGSLERSWDHLELRLDSTNALNHVTFPSWNTVVGSALFGLPTTANTMRSVQTTLRITF